MLAERAAWELAKLHGIDLVTILPNFVMGPALSPASAAGSTSIGFLKVRLGIGDVPSRVSSTWSSHAEHVGSSRVSGTSCCTTRNPVE